MGDDFDVFGDDGGDDAEAAEMLARKRAEAEEKKAEKKKAEPIAKSSILLEIKPLEAETDMKELEDAVRSIEREGLLWGASRLEDVAYGVKKLVMSMVVVDDLVSVDDIEEAIQSIELVQSTDIRAFNKI
eukprot:TRINITY_DN687_c0_g3_i5.p1 TRINITY_DN687_c0_g3~~TRINITY_DN687_c0_g3_i5.p1  ORF type:complete len:140 (-),score=84.14 TRINITY_DN687_c0_g3_i5:47-436(-)